MKPRKLEHFSPVFAAPAARGIERPSRQKRLQNAIGVRLF
jgi:hypothetical protein